MMANWSQMTSFSKENHAKIKNIKYYTRFVFASYYIYSRKLFKVCEIGV